MKQKKQIRMTLVFLIAVTVVLVGWWLIGPSKLRAASQVSGRSQSSEIDSLTKMPLSGEKAATDWARFGEGSGPFGAGSDSRWKNATAGEMIPAKYSFAVSQMKDSVNPENSTYIMDVSPGITQMAQELGYTDPYLVNPKGKAIYAAPARHGAKPDDDPESFAKVAVAFPTRNGDAQWMKLANVGYYNGERLNVKVTVKPDQATPSNDRLNWIGWSGTQFLESLFKKELGSLDVSFEFFTLSDSGIEIPTAITGNWPMYLRYPQTEVSVLSPTVSDIINVYSVSPAALPLPLLMSYRINENSQLELSSKSVSMAGGINYSTQTCGVLTFENSQKISYRVTPLATYTGTSLSVMYNFQPPVAAEVPAPTAKNHVVPTIYDFSQSDLYLEFNQFIPFEPVNYRDQSLKWEIAQQSVDTPVEYDSGTWENGWEVKNKQAVDSKNLFDFDFETGNGEITLKSNQYTALFQASNNYLFKQKMKINYKKMIDSTLLRKVNEPDNTDGYYLPRKAKVTLSGRMPNTQKEVSKEYTTWINFAANVEYQRYAVAEDGTATLIDTINTADANALATLGISQPLITHDAPIPTIAPDGYIQDKKTPEYVIPQVDTTVNNSKQLQITGAAADETGEKNIVKVYYRIPAPTYTLQVRICKPGQDGKVGEVVSFDSSIDHPFKLQDDISKGIGDDAWPYEGSFLENTDRKIVGFPDCTFEWEIKYRVKQTATPGEDYTLWDVDNKSMTKPFSFKDGEIPTLTVFNGDDGGDPREYFLGYEGDTYPINRDDAPATATWFAKYDRSTKVLTFYFVNEEVPPGELTWTVPDYMDFGEVNVPLMKDLDQYLIQDAQKPWQIQVEDKRKNRDPWRISARLEEEFVSEKNGQTLPSILKFKEESVDQTLTKTAPVEIYQSETQPGEQTTIDWQSPNGFYLGLKALGSYPVGEANARVEFVLITGQ